MRLPWFDTGDADSDGWERPGPTPAQQRRDVLVGLTLAAASLGSAVLGVSAGAFPARLLPGTVETVGWCLALSLPLVVRRRYPLTSLLTVSAAFIGLQSRFVPEQQIASVCLFLALFTAGAWGRDRQVTRIARGGVVLVMFAFLAYQVSSVAWSKHDPTDSGGPISPELATTIYLTAINALYFGAALAFGTMAWNRARQERLLRQRTEELAQERDANAQRAVVAERLRIARELHDVVAHHVSVMGIQAAAARRVLDQDAALARRTLGQVEDSGRVAVDELHGLLSVLRGGPEASGGASADPQAGGRAGAEMVWQTASPAGDEPLAALPAPGVERLGELVSRTDAAGLRAELTVVGDAIPLPGGVSVSAYRIVQEALTNCLRHAAASRVDVRLRYLPGAVEVEVVDDGRAPPAPPQGRPATSATASASASATASATRRSSGMGHVGMRERVAVHGGTLEIGPRPGGGFRVRARLPVARTFGCPADLTTQTVAPQPVGVRTEGAVQ